MILTADETKATNPAEPTSSARPQPPFFMDEWEIEINECIWRQQADGWFDDSLSRE